VDVLLAVQRLLYSRQINSNMNACDGDFSAVHTDSQCTRCVHLRAVAKKSTGIINKQKSFGKMHNILKRLNGVTHSVSSINNTWSY
jgi:hypothetical protein